MVLMSNNNFIKEIRYGNSIIKIYYARDEYKYYYKTLFPKEIME
jgi:hypothetical protein